MLDRGIFFAGVGDVVLLLLQCSALEKLPSNCNDNKGEGNSGRLLCQKECGNLCGSDTMSEEGVARSL